ncbi:MAG: hypothetical protein D6754_14465 [Alphaproteobacteria bacterium]|nr:MAG: hypothetical protein D6754_14465 [Alphaproteobacteria bacterium]
MADITLHALAMAFGLGLLGFLEPCTIGAHMLFLAAQHDRAMARRLQAGLVFLAARIAVMGGFGGLIAMFGQRLIGVQTGAWLVFGVIYSALGLAVLSGWDRPVRRRIGLAPERWKSASHPLVQGLAFGLNIPACAAPILFALIGTAAAVGSAATGFVMMAVFAAALSLPLVPLSAVPRLARPLDRLAGWLRPRRWLPGAILILLGLWSLWFGLFVDPADWSGR